MRKTPFVFILIIAGIVLGILASEIILRLVNYSYPLFFTTDEKLGVVLRPGIKSWYRREGNAFVQINSAGLRDKEHAKEKPANALRIAVLGDSFADAWQVPLEDTFWSVMERRLQNCEKLKEKKAEVINFGGSGFGTARELIMLRYKVWDYSPDVVILAFFSGNDVRDNSKKLNPINYIPYFVYDSNKKLILDNSFLDSKWYKIRQTKQAKIFYKLIDSSRLLQLLKEVNNTLKNKYLEKRKQQTVAELSNNIDLALDNMVYFPPKDDLWREAWQITEDLLVLMKNEVKQKGADFLVVTLGSSTQVNPDHTVRERFMKQLGVDDLFYPDRRIKSLGEKQGFPVLCLTPIFLGYAQSHGIFLHGFKNTGNRAGHWNKDGHRLAGEVIAKEICEMLSAADNR